MAVYGVGKYYLHLLNKDKEALCGAEVETIVDVKPVNVPPCERCIHLASDGEEELGRYLLELRDRNVASGRWELLEARKGRICLWAVFLRAFVVFLVKNWGNSLCPFLRPWLRQAAYYAQGSVRLKRGPVYGVKGNAR